MTRTQPGTLIYRRLDGTEEQIQLHEDVTTIGRSDTCDVVVPEPTVSRLHARIELNHDRYLLYDAGSANGTYLNGQHIEHSYELRTDDEIWLGSSDAALRFTDPDETVMITLAENVPLVVDEQSRSVQLYKTPVSLSPLEYRLLVYLASNPGTVCTREACFLAAWGQPYDHAVCEDALNNCISKLRRNLRATAEIVGQEPPQIVTIPRFGFRLDAEVAFITPPEPHTPFREQALGE